MPELAATIRHARPTDAAAIARVHVATWQDAYPGMLPEHYLAGMTEGRQVATWRHWITAPGRAGAVKVAEAPTGPKPEIVGFGSCGSMRAGLPYAGEVFTLYVATDWQGHGLGRRLLRALFEALVRRGTADAALWVLADNPARFFYEAMGGRRVGARQEAFAGTRLDELAYAWPDLRGWLKDGPSPR